MPWYQPHPWLSWVSMSAPFWEAEGGSESVCVTIYKDPERFCSPGPPCLCLLRTAIIKGITGAQDSPRSSAAVHLVKHWLIDISQSTSHALLHNFSLPSSLPLQLRIINCSFVSVICSQGIKCHLISQNKNSTVIIIASLQKQKKIIIYYRLFSMWDRFKCHWE